MLSAGLSSKWPIPCAFPGVVTGDLYFVPPAKQGKLACLPGRSPALGLPGKRHALPDRQPGHHRTRPFPGRPGGAGWCHGAAVRGWGRWPDWRSRPARCGWPGARSWSRSWPQSRAWPRVDLLCIGKTGTLTRPGMRVTGTWPEGGWPGTRIAEVLAAMAAADEAPNGTIRAVAARYDTPPGGGCRRRYRSPRRASGAACRSPGTAPGCSARPA